MRAGTVILAFSCSLLFLGALADKVLGTPAVVRAAGPAVRLTGVGVGGIAADVRRTAFTETAILLKPAGVDVAWETSDGLGREEAADELQVVLLPSAPSSMERLTMGAAYPRAGRSRAVWVFVGAVRAALGL